MTFSLPGLLFRFLSPVKHHFPLHLPSHLSLFSVPPILSPPPTPLLPLQSPHLSAPGAHSLSHLDEEELWFAHEALAHVPPEE